MESFGESWIKQLEIIVDFGSSYGIWVKYNNSAAWTKIHSLNTEWMTIEDIDKDGQDDLIVDFGNEHGTWVWHNDSTWMRL